MSIEQCPLCDTAVQAVDTHCPSCGGDLRQAALLVALSERVARLEARLDAVAKRPAAADDRRSEPAPPPTVSVRLEAVAAAHQARAVPEQRRPPAWLQSDFWINKIGLLLLLLGLVFLFNYAVDQGWLTPLVRVAIGLSLGTLLLGAGHRIAARRPALARVLAGGGIVAYYISGFAAFQLYDLVPFPVALGFMTLVTALAYTLALRQNDAALALIGGLGGLATPFLLDTGSGNVPGLLLHTAVIGASLVAIYVVRGWRLPLWLATTGGWLIAFIAVITASGGNALLWGLNDHNLAILSTLVFNLLLFWVAPVWREAGRGWGPPPSLGVARAQVAERTERLFDVFLYPIIVANPLAGLALALMHLFDLAVGERALGAIALVAAAVLTAAAWLVFRARDDRTAAESHLVPAVLALTLALALLLDGEAHFLAWALEAAGLLLVVRWVRSRVLPVAGAVLMVGVVGWLLARVLLAADVPPVFNGSALNDLVVIALLLGVSRLLPASAPPEARILLRVAAHLAILGWLWRELSPLANGQGLVSVAWGIYGVGLLLAALHFRWRNARLAALATLLLLVGKLFLVDLAAVATVVRILLFAGFGALFLLLSYFLGERLNVSADG